MGRQRWREELQVEGTMWTTAGGQAKEWNPATV